MVQEFTVMGDHEDRAGIIEEVILEPDERFEIEMVRRFVEQEQVGLLHQQTRKMRAHHPAAAEGLCWAVEIGFAEGEAGEDALCLRLKLPAAVLIEHCQRLMMLMREFLSGVDFMMRWPQVFGDFRRDGACKLQAPSHRPRGRFPAGGNQLSPRAPARRGRHPARLRRG